MIHEIENSIGVVTNDQKEINERFKIYYEKLYKSELPSNTNKSTRTSFLDSLDFPTLSIEDQEILDSPMKLSELDIALADMKRGKDAGPDGLPIYLFKTFKDKLLPPFLDTLEEAFKTNSLPPSLSKALILNILKPGKPPSKYESYRPISLLNADAKLIAKVIAKRLENLLPGLIHVDQNGFVRGRQAFQNLRRVLNIVRVRDEMRPFCPWTLKKPSTELNGCTYLKYCLDLV